MEIAASIVAELEKIGAPYHAWVLEEHAARPLVDMPREILEDLEPEPGLDLRRPGADQ